MTPFGTHRNDPVLTGIADHNGGFFLTGRELGRIQSVTWEAA